MEDNEPRIGNRLDAIAFIEIMIEEVKFYPPHSPGFFLKSLEAIKDALEREII
ncbi:hypothetical protein LQZ19_05190 [Treponema primitia]|uniref:hypothetical protein n=1 Tax=Treponema primitia TaxID=88058 RepID=UPI0039818527